MNFDDFRFFGQAISYATSADVESYELLLRGKSEKSARFPTQAFSSCIQNHTEHKAYIVWLEKTIRSILQLNPDKSFSLNLDHQELEYEETFVFLKHLVQYRNRLMIEITEVPAVHRGADYFCAINVAAFKRIYEMGYKVAMDDVMQGINSLGNVTQVVNYICRIKFSMSNFRQSVDDEIIKQLLMTLSIFAHQLNKEFVIEGVEDCHTAKWVAEHTISLNQGYYYSQPSNVYPIAY